MARDITVYCTTCKKRIPEKDTEFVDIEEDFQGYDLLTFICPICGNESKSKRA